VYCIYIHYNHCKENGKEREGFTRRMAYKVLLGKDF
jgi:hypothetical protein